MFPLLTSSPQYDRSPLLLDSSVRVNIISSFFSYACPLLICIRIVLTWGNKLQAVAGAGAAAAEDTEALAALAKCEESAGQLCRLVYDCGVADVMMSLGEWLSMSRQARLSWRYTLSRLAYLIVHRKCSITPRFSF